jgi:hypothetical protein
LNRANAGADQLQNFAADGLDHPAHLTIAAFADRDLDVRVLAGVAHTLDVRRASRTIAEFHAAAQLIERGVGNQIGALHQICFRDFVIGVGEALGELGVVRENQEAAGVEVEAADG